VQVADLRRDTERKLETLIDAVTHVAAGGPGAASTSVPAASGARRTLGTGVLVGASVLIAATLILGVAMWRRPDIEPPSTTAPPNTGTSANPPVAELVRVPDFVGAETKDIVKAAQLIGLQLVMTDERGTISPFLEGVVTSQTPIANAQVERGRPVTVQVATRTAVVPLLIRLPLKRAREDLLRSGLRLGRTVTVEVQNATPGTIVRQSPDAGARVSEGSLVDVTVAASPRRKSPAR
jgi:hypothetical protein